MHLVLVLDRLSAILLLLVILEHEPLEILCYRNYEIGYSKGVLVQSVENNYLYPFILGELSVQDGCLFMGKPCSDCYLKDEF